jgi:serine/threonine protein kinase
MCPKDEFKVGRPTSDGTCVYAGLRISDGKEVAVKCMLTDNCEHLAENETQIYNMLLMETSPHVVRYLHYRPEATFTYIVLELCEFSLTEYVNRARDDPQIPFDPQKIIREILTGLKILHKQGNEGMILHRDLKPDNVLVDVRWSIRLADFGVSKRVGEGIVEFSWGRLLCSKPVRIAERLRGARSTPFAGGPYDVVIVKRERRTVYNVEVQTSATTASHWLRRLSTHLIG